MTKFSVNVSGRGKPSTAATAHVEKAGDSVSLERRLILRLRVR